MAITFENSSVTYAQYHSRSRRLNDVTLKPDTQLKCSTRRREEHGTKKVHSTEIATLLQA